VWNRNICTPEERFNSGGGGELVGDCNKFCV